MDRPSPLNQATVDSLRALKRPGQPSLLVRISGIYEQEAAEILGRLRDAIEQSKADDLRQMAHRLKSVSGNVGAETLAVLCKELEAQGREGQLEGAAAMLDRLEAEHERVRQALSDAVDREPSG